MASGCSSESPLELAGRAMPLGSGGPGTEKMGLGPGRPAFAQEGVEVWWLGLYLACGSQEPEGAVGKLGSWEALGSDEVGEDPPTSL